MLKFVSQNDKNNEKSAQDELGIKTNLLDFFSTSDPNTISEKINSTLTEMKNKSKKEDSFYTKLIYYFSILINSKSFKIDDKSKKSIKNLIQICDSQARSKIYQDLFYLFDNYQKELKKAVLLEIPLSKIDFTEEELISLYSLFSLFIIDDKKLNRTYNREIVDIFAELIAKHKKYHLLKKINNIENLRIIIRDEMLTKKESISGNIFTSKLLFFLTLSSQDLVDEDLEGYNLEEKLKEEKKLFDSLENRKDEEILFKKDNIKYFEENYGEKGAELILNGAKESCIHEILSGFEENKQTKISFKEFIYNIFEDDDDNKKIEFKDDEVMEKFEEIEDMLISGKEHKLYNIAIDYFKKEIKIVYLRKQTYGPEQKANLLNKVKNIKSKLELILKAIDKI
jgi:hypothetical protein